MGSKFHGLRWARARWSTPVCPHSPSAQGGFRKRVTHVTWRDDMVLVVQCKEDSQTMALELAVDLEAEDLAIKWENVCSDAKSSGSRAPSLHRGSALSWEGPGDGCENPSGAE